MTYLNYDAYLLRRWMMLLLEQMEAMSKHVDFWS